jgi:hypothetical protein
VGEVLIIYVFTNANPSVLTSIAVLLTLFGASIVFVLLIANTVQGLYNQIIDSTYDHNYCVIIVLVVLVLWPITMLESPKDFWSVLVLVVYYLCRYFVIGSSILSIGVTLAVIIGALMWKDNDKTGE